MKNRFQGPLKPKEAREYLTKHRYDNGRVIVGTAKSVAARMCVMLSATDIEVFQQVLYDENQHLAYRLLAEMYTALEEPLPMFLRAYAGCSDIFGTFMECLSIEIRACEIYLKAYMDWVTDKDCHVVPSGSLVEEDYV